MALSSGSPTQRRAIKLRLGQKINGESFLGTMRSEQVISVIKEITTPTLPRVNLSDRPGTVSPIRNAIFQSTKANLEVQVDFSNEPQVRLVFSLQFIDNFLNATGRVFTYDFCLFKKASHEYLHGNRRSIGG